MKRETMYFVLAESSPPPDLEESEGFVIWENFGKTGKFALIWDVERQKHSCFSYILQKQGMQLFSLLPDGRVVRSTSL